MATTVAPTRASHSVLFASRRQRAVLGALVAVVIALMLAIRPDRLNGPLGLLVAVAVGSGAYWLGRARRRDAASAASVAVPAREPQIDELRRLEAVGQLAGGVAHDFNNILTVIGIHSEFLLAGLDPSESHHVDAREIHQAAMRASMLTKQLLAFSRRQGLQMHPVNLNDVVREIAPMLGRLIGEDIEVRARLDPDIGIVLADPGQVQQVIMNLAVNARDAMPDGGTITISTTAVELDATYAIEHRTVVPGDYVMLTVSDTGCGMSADVRARIFEPFFTTKPPGVGTGLGLATVFGIVRQSGGYIWVYSEVGEGTAFKIYLPLAAGQAGPVRDPEQPVGARGSETILVVEDEPNVREATRRILVQHGYDVLAAPNGPDALAIAEAIGRPITLLLTDVVLPEEHGPWIVERLTDLHPGVRILYMSGYTDTDIARRGLGATATTLQKPFSSHALLHAVRAALDGEPPAHAPAALERAAP